MNLFKNWDKKDYNWFILILLGIIGIILTWRLNDNDSVVNIISMIASGASITLAVIAIIQSTSYNESANNTYNAITEKLIKLEHNTDDIKQKIMTEVNAVIEDSNIPEEEKDDLKANIEANVEKEIINTKTFNKSFKSIAFYELVDRIKTICRNGSQEVYSIDCNKGDLLLITSNKKKIYIEIMLVDYISIATVHRKIEKIQMSKDTIAILVYSKSTLKRIGRFEKYSNFIRILSDNEISTLQDEELKSRLNLLLE